MSVINSNVYENLPDLVTGKTYKILKAEVVVTRQQGYDAVELEVEDVPTGEMHGTMLWLQERIGSKTKAGTFVKTLGKDTAKWKGKVIQVVSWAEKNREIAVLK